MLELQRTTDSSFLQKSKISLFFTNLNATGVVGSVWIRKCHPPNFIEKFSALKENFHFEIRLRRSLWRHHMDGILKDGWKNILKVQREKKLQPLFIGSGEWRACLLKTARYNWQDWGWLYKMKVQESWQIAWKGRML